MLKGFLLLGGSEHLAIFHDAYLASARHLKRGAWYVDVHAASGQVVIILYIYIYICVYKLIASTRR